MLPEVLDVLMITETKLDDSFLEQQFPIEGFNIPFRLDGNRYGESPKVKQSVIISDKMGCTSCLTSGRTTKDLGS